MKVAPADNGVVRVKQELVVIPDLSIKQLLAVIPKHCFKRSLVRSFRYILQDVAVVLALYKATKFVEPLLNPAHLSLPHPSLYSLTYFALWSLYGFCAGLFSMGLWNLGHECGHQAFSQYKTLNHIVGWTLHSSFGTPYHPWRITHSKHHASTNHMALDENYIPWTRSQYNLPPFNPEAENIEGSMSTEKVMKELREAVGDTPMAALYDTVLYLVRHHSITDPSCSFISLASRADGAHFQAVGFPMYMLRNAAGQPRYPAGTSHFDPRSPFFAPHHFWKVIVSDLGVFLWLAALGASVAHWGLAEVFRVYLVPYVWVNHWIVLITFLQHTDPVIPHWRAESHTFVRGAFSTLNRSLMGDLGPIMGWIGGVATHGLSETHIAHHVSSMIPHYNAWEAADALRKHVAQYGVKVDGGAGGWAEMYRVFKECKFVEDEGGVLFWKNGSGLAAARALFQKEVPNDSGIEVEK
ncbi:delta-12 fatty acid desaturase [Gloeopeniophorella convolvens]|nr:delta-12 fatty acid desaturase [Gloeopeniophorella convolvens]